MYTRVLSIIIVVAAVAAALYWYSYRTGAPAAQEADTATLIQRYTHEDPAFSLSFPGPLASSSASNAEAYTVDETYRYEALGPGRSIEGVKFTIPSAYATGTNLAADSYLSVEWVDADACSALHFADGEAQLVQEGGVTYSVISNTDAAVGNRYEDTIYAIVGSSPCIAVRTLLHYGAYELYPEGSIEPFERETVTSQWDAIRRSLALQ